MSQRIDEYTILRTLKEGPSGKVLLAEHKSLGSRRVLKIIPRQDPEAVLILNEARTIERLRNEAIPIIFDIWDDENNIILAEEFIEGESLTSFLKRKQYLSKSELLDYSVQLSQIISFIHNPANLLLHLDLKPENLMISNGKMKLIDFGSARAPRIINMETPNYGTVGFCAPEQMDGRYVTASADLYALGKIYEFMSLYTPISFKGYREIVNRLLRKSKPLYESAEQLYKDLLKLKKKKEIYYQSGYFISVRGIPTDHHSTTFAFRLAKKLYSMSGKKVILLDCNKAGNLEALEIPEKEEPQNYIFEIEGIYVAKRVLPEEVKGWGSKGFDFLICDFGNESPLNSCLPFACSIVVGSIQPWNREKLLEAFSETQKISSLRVIDAECNEHFSRTIKKVVRCILKDQRKNPSQKVLTPSETTQDKIQLNIEAQS